MQCVPFIYINGEGKLRDICIIDTEASNVFSLRPFAQVPEVFSQPVFQHFKLGQRHTLHHAQRLDEIGEHKGQCEPEPFICPDEKSNHHCQGDEKNNPVQTCRIICSFHIVENIVVLRCKAKDCLLFYQLSSHYQKRLSHLKVCPEKFSRLLRQNMLFACGKSGLPPSAAKFYLETVLDSLILRSKINESSTVSNDYLARSAELCFERHVIFTPRQGRSIWCEDHLPTESEYF
jgi:hypothetical protein